MSIDGIVPNTIMLTEKDINNIIKANSEVFATKEQIIEAEERLNSRINSAEERLNARIDLLETELHNRFDQILTAVDAYAKKSDAFFQELVVANHKIDRHEKWLHQISEKLDVRLEY